MRLTPVGDVQIQDESQPNETVLDPSIAREYLHAASKELGNPRINVARYESSQGLIATYQAASGKRIVFAANLGPEGKIRAQALHVNPTTGKLEGIINRSKDVGDDGKPLRDVTIDGVNMRAFIKNSVQKTNGHAEKESRLKHFLADDTGDAFLEGLPALYAALEGMESEAELASLAAPFGAVAMVLQLGTKEFRGFKHVDKVLGANKAQAMRNACDPADDCVARGKHFVIHRSGLFDVLGKQKNRVVGQIAPSSIAMALSVKSTPVEMIRRLSSPILPPQHALNLDGDGRCVQASMDRVGFGMCGTGMGLWPEVGTIQCLGHDYCVCAHGNLACVFSTPSACGLADGVVCYSLIDAAISYFENMWDCFFEWLDIMFGACPSDQLCPETERK